MHFKLGGMVWLGVEVVGTVQESGGVKEALKDLAKDTKEIVDAYKGE